MHSETWAYAFWLWLALSLGITPLVADVYIPEIWFNSVCRGITAIIAYLWVLADADEESYKPSKGLEWGVLLLPFLFVPYYIFRAKGWRRAVVSYAKFTSFCVAFFCLLFVLHKMTGWTP